jgi:hypothetical protein
MNTSRRDFIKTAAGAGISINFLNAKPSRENHRA